MKRGHVRWLQRVLAGIAALCSATVVLSCGDNARLIRQATYPPAFRYISDAELESVMWRLAGRIHELERMNSVEAPQVAALSALLAKIDADARSLSSQDAGSNHPYLQPRLQEFLEIVGRARLDLQRTPPRRATVEEVWRACSGCHSRS